MTIISEEAKKEAKELEEAKENMQTQKIVNAVVQAISNVEDKNSIGYQLTSLSDKIDGVETKLTQKIEGVETKLTQKIEGVETKLTQKIEGVETKLTQKIDGVEQRLTNRLDEHDKRFDKIEASLDLNNPNGSLSRLKTDLENRIDQVTQTQNQQNNRLITLETIVDRELPARSQIQ
ncbi:hypothetical protein HC766_03345 [Candidatus Gracilibacteria bacterium]|nr:hypothetical protein [Candidatus Gracilibacteria bacterium]